MTIAVMQPYFFPYIGYFQMINAVDKFVFYDDVNFIKQGWINRNRILLNKTDFLITVPIQKADSFIQIKDTYINHNLFPNWKKKTLQTISQAYKKAPYFEPVYAMITEVMETPYDSISEMAIASTIATAAYIGIETDFIISSDTYHNAHLDRQDRLIDICHREKAIQYINALGGFELYKKEDFEKEHIQLKFIKSSPISYTQFQHEFIPWLSIIDVLMFNNKEEIFLLLDQYELI